MFPLAGETRHRIAFGAGLMSILCAGLVAMRTLGPQLSDATQEYSFQMRRFFAGVADGSVPIEESKTFIVVGDSTASRAFPLELSTTGTALSFALHGGTALDSYFLLKRYLKSHRAPPCIVLMTSYGATPHNYPVQFWSLLVSRNFYLPEELEELYSVSAQHGVFPARDFSYAGYRLEIASQTLFNLFDWRAISDLVFKPYSRREAVMSYQSVRKGRGSMPFRRGAGRMSRTTTDYQQHLSEEFRAEPLADYAISQLAKITGANLLIMNPPVSERLQSPKSEHWFDLFAAHMKSLTMKYPSVILNLQSPWLKDLEFYDPTHLNAEGGIEFIRKSQQAINACVARSSHPATMPSPAHE